MEKTKEEIEKDLVALKESVKESDKPEPEAAFSFPRNEATIYGFDKKTRMFFLAIPVDKTEPIIALCIIDAIKLKYMEAMNVYMAIKNKILTADRTAFQKMKAFVTRKK